MIVEQIYTGCLAQGAYYIESDGQAAVIDPLRETEPYLKRAEKSGAKIKYIFETHFHADFVSGHIDLAKKTGAKIVYGPLAETEYKKHEAKDGEEFKIGKLTMRVLHTPGHTPESTTYLLMDESGKEYAIFSGDTLFIGDVGRPDLAQKTGKVTTEDLAGMLFDSLRNKIMPLSDEILVYPAHGAGSACGKNMSSETVDTLGNQKKTNYALRANMSKEEFIKEVTDGIMPPPKYFELNVKLNKSGYESIDMVMERGVVPLEPDEFERAVNFEGAVIIDTRNHQEFAKGFIPNSIFIGIDGSFAPWVGALVPDIKQAIAIVCDEGREEEIVMRLARVGYDNAIGFLKGGIPAWKKAGKELDTIESIPALEFEKIYMKNPEVAILDVRKPSEYDAEHLANAKLFTLDWINDHMHEVKKSNQYYLHCRSGYRSMVAASILKARGFHKIVDLAGGMAALSETSIPRVEKACSSTIV